MGYLLLLLYSLLAPVIAALYALYFLLSPRRSLMKSLGGELGERLALAVLPVAGAPVWLHTASMGEVKAISKLAPELAAAEKAPLLITASTSSGRAEASRLTPGARFAPLDFYPLVKRFITRHRPRMLVVIETEIWPAMFIAAARAGVPVYLANARISPGTLALYRALGPLSRLMFSGVKQVLAQSEADALRFRSLPGLADKVTVTGNLKHDQLGASGAGADKVKEFLKAAGWEGCPLFTAGSTHPAEEPLLADAFLEAKKTVPGLKLALVPRHPERLAETEAALRERCVEYTKWSTRETGRDCVIVDAMGLLQAFYAVSAVCFVGGTLDDTGGHNLLEPALYSKPVLFGPNYRNARQAGESLLKEKGGFLTGTAPAMALKLSELLNAPAQLQAACANSAKALSSLKGATARTLAALSR
ncbi:MAG TPA: hypothetical protein DCZ92_02645 [Elusimicrobia bacterium]|nr:MAG: hypothetical protein A2016_02070 [Elusimicrobia bacterium GWF2_62_30]HBA59722.1 hypothetical protein [Elusimicrobiota bacterium]